MSKRLDLIGKRFGRLVVISLFAYIKNGKTYLWCLCDCGEYVIVRGDHLKSGGTTSCGCFHREMVSKSPLKETKKKISETLKGHRHTRETIRKISESLKGRKCPKRSIAMTGKHHTKETRRKMSKRRRGKDNSNYKHGLSKIKTVYNALKRARRLNQTPADADMDKIEYIYRICKIINQLENKKYEVDHIKPLSKGGLHHQDNLQILEKTLNCKKHAKLISKYQGIRLLQLEKGGKLL